MPEHPNNATRLTSEILNLPRMDYYPPATDDQARVPRKAGARKRVPNEPLAGRGGFSWETQGRSERAGRERRAGVLALLQVVSVRTWRAGLLPCKGGSKSQRGARCALQWRAACLRAQASRSEPTKMEALTLPLAMRGRERIAAERGRTRGASAEK